jgi:hypothetical protein
MANFEYDVALSFSGKDRSFVEPIAKSLLAHQVKVFYDVDEQATLWGKDLYVHLSDVYGSKARFCLIFVSKNYAESVWTSHERQVAQARALRERGTEYILPVRIDETEIPGLVDTIGYVSIQQGPDHICRLVLSKLRQSFPVSSIAQGFPRPPESAFFPPAAPASIPSPYLTPDATSWNPFFGPAGGPFGAIGRHSSSSNLAQSYAVHRLQAAFTFQSRPQFRRLADWLEHSQLGLFALIGLGGSGKTAIVEQLLRCFVDPMLAQRLDVSHVTEQVMSRFVFSFYSQDSTVDVFFAALSDWLQVSTSAEELTRSVKRALLSAGEVARSQRRKLLIVVDGIEEVQSRRDADTLTGSLTDARMRSLLSDVASGCYPGVCVLITSRLPLPDIDVLRPPFYEQEQVGSLGSEAARGLLRALGVKGTDAELLALVVDYAEHALTLDLVGNFIARFYGGNCGAFRQMERDVFERAASLRAGPGVDAQTEIVRREAAKLGRIAGFYYSELKAASPLAFELLKLIVLFRLPADARRFTRLRRTADPSATPSAVQEDEVSLAFRQLNELHLLSSAGDGRYILHPGVREAFYGLLSEAEQSALQNAIVGGLKVELEDRATEPVLDAARIELIRAYALHLLDFAARAGSEDVPALVRAAWACLNDPVPDGLGGWLETVWGKARTSAAVVEVCEAIERALPDEIADGESGIGSVELRRLWSHALENVGRVEEGLLLLKRESSKHRLDAKSRDELAGVRAHLLGLRGDLHHAKGERANRADTRKDVHASMSCAISLAKIGDVRGAWEALDVGLKGYLETGDYVQYAWNCGEISLSRALLVLGDARRASVLAAQAVREAEVLDGPGTAAVYNARTLEAAAWVALGEPGQALRTLAEHTLVGRSLVDDVERRVVEVQALFLNAMLAPHSSSALLVCRDELLKVLTDIRSFGLSIEHSRALVTLAEVELALGAPQRALQNVKTALFGQRRNDDSVALYAVEALDEPRNPVVLGLDQNEREDPRGIFPPPGSDRPSLLAITHSFCGHRRLEAEARLVYAKALVLLGREEARSEALHGDARREIEKALAISAVFHRSPDLAAQDLVYQTGLSLLSALESGSAASVDWTRPVLLGARSCDEKVAVSVVSSEKTLRRFAYSLSFPAGHRALAEEIAAKLRAPGDEHRVLLESCDVHDSVERLLYEKSLLLDSAVIVIVAPDAATNEEPWVGLSREKVRSLPRRIQERIVYLSPHPSNLEAADGIKRLDLSQSFDALAETLASVLASVDQADRMKDRMYYLKFKPKAGRRAHYFVLIEPAKEAAFLKALKGKDKFNLEHFGTIVKSGYGEPTPELKQEMKERYSIKYDDEDDNVASAEASKQATDVAAESALSADEPDRDANASKMAN